MALTTDAEIEVQRQRAEQIANASPNGARPHLQAAPSRREIQPVSGHGPIVEQWDVPEIGSPLTFKAANARRERTGVHASVSIVHGDTSLAWSLLNIERDEDRTRLANSAHRNFSDVDKRAFPVSNLKHILDLFCAELWDKHVQGLEGELMEGDPDIGPPKQLVGPYVIEGGGTIIFAPPGRGKSYILMAMAVSLDAGCAKVWPVRESRRLLVINLERSRDSMRYRLARVNRALGLDARRPLLFLNARGRSLLEMADGVAETVRKERVETLFIDSISRSGMGDLSDSTVANKIVDTLNGLCPTWLALAHSPRSDESHIFGSVHFEAGEDVGVRLLSQVGEQITGIGLEVVKVNDLAPPPLAAYALTWGPDGLGDIRTARRHEFPEIEAGKRLTLPEEIAEYLKLVGTASGTDIAEALKRNRSNVSSLLSSDSRFVRVGKQGREMHYGLRASAEYDTSSNTSGGQQI